MSSPRRPLAGLTQDAHQAGPLCPRVPVLSILELASRDARRRPLCLPENGDSPELREHLDEVRRHVHEERCPACRRWLRNATRAYSAALRQRLRPFARKPRKVAASPEYLEFALAARAKSAGLGALEGRLIWRREENEAGWRLVVQFRRALTGKGVAPASFAAVALEVFFEEPGRDAPARVQTRLDLGSDGVLSSPEEFVDLERPDRVCRVRVRPQAPWGALDL